MRDNNNALGSGKPRTPMPGQCGALAGDFSSFRLTFATVYVGFSTTLDASIGKRDLKWGLDRNSLRF